MLAPRDAPMSAEAFLVWAAACEDRFELSGGYPVRLMAGAKQSHTVVVGNVADALRQAAKTAGCQTTSSDTAVITAADCVRYPDIVVDCGPPDPDAMAAALPTIVVEVLSRSTSQIDFSDKLDEYRGLPSVTTILLIDPDRVSVKLYRRDGDGLWMAERYDKLGQSFALDRIGVTIALATVYDTLRPLTGPRMEVVSSVEGDAPAMLYAQERPS